MSNTEFPLVAIFHPKPENYQEVLDFLKRVTLEVHAEPGCVFYALHETQDQRLVYVEKWATKLAWVQHSKSESVSKIHNFIAGKLTREVDVIELTPITSGDKGLL